MSKCKCTTVVLDRNSCVDLDLVSGKWINAQSIHVWDVDCTDANVPGIKYRANAAAPVTLQSVEEMEEKMNCTYTHRMVFQHMSMLRNYPFWGYGDVDAEVMDFHQLFKNVDFQTTHDMLIVQPVALPLTGLGLFAQDRIEKGVFLGEYTGVLREEYTRDHDPYGVSYQSVCETASVYLSAKEYGNIMRCINHSSREFNCKFAHVLYRGLLHMACMTTRPILPNEQLYMNYGKEYWGQAGYLPSE